VLRDTYRRAVVEGIQDSITAATDEVASRNRGSAAVPLPAADGLATGISTGIARTFYVQRQGAIARSGLRNRHDVAILGRAAMVRSSVRR
jgi:hypothetical protein